MGLFTFVPVKSMWAAYFSSWGLVEKEIRNGLGFGLILFKLNVWPYEIESCLENCYWTSLGRDSLACLEI